MGNDSGRRNDGTEKYCPEELSSLKDRFSALEELEEFLLRLVNESDQDKILDMVAEAAARAINGMTIAVPILSPDSREVLYDHAYGRHKAAFINLVLPIEDAGLCGWVLENRRPIVTNKLLDDPRVKRELAISLGLTSAVLVPLIARGRIIGGISAFNKTDGTPFTEDDVKTLARLAAHAALIMDNARLLGELRREKAKVEYVLDSVRDGIALLSNEGVLLDINYAMGRIFSAPPEDLVGANIQALTSMSPVARAFEWAEKAHPGKHCWEVLDCKQKDCPVYKADILRCWSFSDGYCHKAAKYPGHSEKIWEACARCEVLSHAREELSKHREVTVSGRIYVVSSELIIEGRDEKMFGEVMVFHDVTDERRSEIQRADFISMITHDLKTPLTSILGYCELMASEDDMVVVRDMNRGVARNAANQLRMINDFLNLSRIEAGMVNLNLIKLSLRPFLGQTLERFMPLAAEKDARLSVAVTEGVPDVLADIDQLTRIIDNLVSNSLKYVHRGGNIRVAAAAGPRGSVELSVQDDGPGIDKDELPRVFERYYTGGTRNKDAGAGLGLSIVKALTEAHGGRVSVENLPEGGVVFSVFLPSA